MFLHDMHIDEDFFLAKYFPKQCTGQGRRHYVFCYKNRDIDSAVLADVQCPAAMKALRNDDQFVCAAERFDMLD